ncbi:signal peptide peptidase-like 2B [Mytilus galloprovincialis]|uniref:Signal peptide peptidase-like 2B n=1 Tax=Mytilus galloprovincialis TaxID=29158 RepID=A0A8B6H804_MYTGA|nr:signal peptide peptidase-like 2B [Mytilus galloprovincialis]
MNYDNMKKILILFCYITLSEAAASVNNIGLVYGRQEGKTEWSDPICLTYNPQYLSTHNPLPTEEKYAIRGLFKDFTPDYGCDDSGAYDGGSALNKIVAVARGNCTFVEKTDMAEQHQAKAVIVVSSTYVSPGINQTSDIHRFTIPSGTMLKSDFIKIQKLGKTVELMIYAPEVSDKLFDPCMVVIFLLAVVCVAVGGFWSGLTVIDRQKKQEEKEKKKREKKYVQSSDQGKDETDDEKEDEEHLDITVPAVIVFFVLVCAFLVLLYFFYDYLESQSKSSSSRPDSASRRRRRPNTKSADRSGKKSKGLSSDEYITSENDSVYSEMNLHPGSPGMEKKSKEEIPVDIAKTLNSCIDELTDSITQNDGLEDIDMDMNIPNGYSAGDSEQEQYGARQKNRHVNGNYIPSLQLRNLSQSEEQSCEYNGQDQLEDARQMSWRSSVSSGGQSSRSTSETRDASMQTDSPFMSLPIRSPMSTQTESGSRHFSVSLTYQCVELC